MDDIQQYAEQIYPQIVLKTEQKSAIIEILNGKDVIVNLPVGFGKSMIFHLLPGLFQKSKKPDKVLVVSPLSAIMQEQVEKLKCVSISAVQLSQNCKIPGHDNVIDAVHHSKIIFAHPEALLVAERGQDILHSLDGQISAIVIDECHKIDDWGKEFRRSFSDLGNLRSYFPYAALVCLSATLTKLQQTELIKVLALSPVVIIDSNPDRPNLYLEVIKKGDGDNFFVDNIYKREIKELKKKGCDYPVTLMFMPLQYMAAAMQYAFSIFGGHVSLENALFACLFSNQDRAVTDVVLSDLQKQVPRFRLVFTTSVIGMGFDPPSIKHIIHMKPPRNLNNYFQEIGRAGRRGQISKATLYYCNADISKNLPGITDDIILYCKSDSCLRSVLLKNFCFIKNEKSPVGCKCCNICLPSCMCDDCILQQSLNNLNM